VCVGGGGTAALGMSKLFAPVVQAHDDLKTESCSTRLQVLCVACTMSFSNVLHLILE